MSQRNVEIVQRFYEAWNARVDVSRLAEDYLHERFEFVNPPYAVEEGVKQGAAAWDEVRASLDGAFHRYEHKPEEFVDLGDRVLCWLEFSAQTREDGVALQLHEGHVWTFSGERAVRFEWHHDRQEALAAAGLREWPPRSGPS